MILFKDTVRIKRLTPDLKFILNKLDEFHKVFITICPSDVVITSINDSTHSERSKHYVDEAIDIRSKNFEAWNKNAFVLEFSRYLNLYYAEPKFTVLLEGLNTPNEHFHIQVKKGFTDAGKD